MTSPLDILTAPSTVKSAPAPVDADTFAQLCERPGAQRFIVDGFINADGAIEGADAVIGVYLDGAAYTVN